MPGNYQNVFLLFCFALEVLSQDSPVGKWGKEKEEKPSISIGDEQGTEESESEKINSL